MPPEIRAVPAENDDAKKWMSEEMGATKHETQPPSAALVPPPPRPYVSEMGPVGAWAFGRTEWNPTSGLTGVRPVADRHSVTLYSPGDWHRQNAQMTEGATLARVRGCGAARSALDTRQRTASELDALHRDSSERLQQRAQDVWRWKAELDRAAQIMWDEIQTLSETPPRLRRVQAALSLAVQVASECINVRCRRPEPDLVRDDAHEELVREAALVHEVKELAGRCLKQALDQLAANRAALCSLQADWSRKSDCYRVDTLARSITAHREPLMGIFQPGATRLPDNQVTPAGWEQTVRTNISSCEQERSRSIALRSLLQPLLDSAVRDVRAQAARSDDAVSRNVALVASTVEHFNEEYRLILQKEAETELVIEDLRVALRNTDPNLKTAQSRLHTRQERTAQENCRDPPQAGLLEEVAKVTAAASALEGQLRNSMNALQELREERARLEAVLVLKRRTLHLDRDRVLQLREHFPSAAALAGLN